MKAKRLGLLVAGALVLPIQAAHGLSVAYIYTGVVTNASGIYASVGATVTGGYVINVAAGDPAQSIGTIGSTSAAWNSLADGGPVYGLPFQSALPFTGSLYGGGVHYSTAAIGGEGASSFVVGCGATLTGCASSPTYDYYGSEQHWYQYDQNGSAYTTFSLYLAGDSPVWTADGLPLFSAATSAAGVLFYAVNGQNVGIVHFDITSVELGPSLVPLPASVWLLLSGLGGLGSMVRKRRATVRDSGATA